MAIARYSFLTASVAAMFASLSLLPCDRETFADPAAPIDPAGPAPTHDAQPKSGQLRATRKPPRIIPWLEANAPVDQVQRYSPGAPGSEEGTTYRDFCLRGIESWERTTDTVLVTTVVGNSKYLYPYLMRRKPLGIHLVGGVKTSILPGASKHSEEPYDFADEAGWRRIAAECQSIAAMTRHNVILLENEGALWRFNTGQETIDLEKLREALAPLRDTGLAFWWYLPEILVATKAQPDRPMRTKELTAAIAEALPGSVFIHAHGWKHDRQNDAYLACERDLRKLVGPDHVIPFIWTTPDGFWRWKGTTKKKRCFNPVEALEEIKHMPGDIAIVYPGAFHWIAVAREFPALFPRNQD